MNYKLKMRNKISVLLITFIFLFLVGFIYLYTIKKDCAGCEGCTYVSFNRTVYISSYKLDEKNKLIRIHFSSASHKKQGEIQIDQQKIMDSELDTLQVASLQNKSLRYQISGKAISKGTCVPYFIRKIKRLTK